MKNKYEIIKRALNRLTLHYDAKLMFLPNFEIDEFRIHGNKVYMPLKPDWIIAIYDDDDSELTFIPYPTEN